MREFRQNDRSVFYVASPFQALCAIAAIRQLKIDDYIFIAQFVRNNPRNSQLSAVLDKFAIKYQICIYESKKVYSSLLKAMIPTSSTYSRLFIGDYRNIYGLLIGIRKVRSHSDIVYLDDGGNTSTLFENLVDISMPSKIIMKLISIARHTKTMKNFLTVYSDIPNMRYNICNLNLNQNLLSMSNNDNKKQDVYIIGTNKTAYCDYLGINDDIFDMKLDEMVKFMSLTYPNDNIIYVPHGRDRGDYAKIICEHYNCEFRPVNMTIEMELLQQPHQPKVIIGYTSSALFSLKKLYPESEVINLLFDLHSDNLHHKQYKKASCYYEKNGIKTMICCI